MNEVWTLTALELRSTYGINKFRHSKDKKAKNRYLLLGLAWLMVIGIVLSYVGGLVYGLCFLGLSAIVPGYLVMLASLLIFAFGLFKAGASLFSKHGYDILTSMPIKTRSIVLSRFFSMYAEDLALTALILVPGTAVYGVMMHPGWDFYISAVVGALFIPAIPLVLSALLGTLIMALSSGMKHKSIVQTVLMVLLVVGILVGSFSMGGVAEGFTLEMLANLATTIGALLGRTYPPVLWLGNAMAFGAWGELLLFAGVSLGLTTLTVFVVARNFHRIMGKLLTFSARHQYSLGTLERRGLLKALYLRELKRYFSSSIYVTNTIIGPILGCILAGVLCFMGLEPIQGAIPFDVSGLIPFVFGAVFCMMTTTSTAISMEGKNFWVVKSLPIPTKTLLDSKILLNLSLMLPFYVLSEIFLLIGLRPRVMEAVWLVLIPAAVILFSVVFGITVNLKFHSFDWEKEEQVVKQSASAALGGFAGMLLSAALGAGYFAIPAQYGDIAKGAACLVLFIATWALYCKNNNTTLSQL